MNTNTVEKRGFELKDKIGAGGFGVVYRAFQLSVGRDAGLIVQRTRVENGAAIYGILLSNSLLLGKGD